MDDMHEQRLMSIGWPYSEAVAICHYMRRNREDLEAFVSGEERKARELLVSER